MARTNISRAKKAGNNRNQRTNKSAKNNAWPPSSIVILILIILGLLYLAIGIHWLYFSKAARATYSPGSAA
ncbi:hypothetical protein ASPVEDRAFT_41736 [Aspergillus versicolor CBS 583.65]|uniref:Uncharacterized protein n=1 Tax=Aspergillus versicolor CBS 583.65 TaxID=1036611 RepID=A0A1L9PL60_ASPVE|nr:uncharacterized protein ASPVEDRAFT_41736 [Aspergillus versicolor CBS 583.65]OJJ02241.1 hypothetical protein ASPVEDRAFT_41736 [Aspergillus versicolor CBS 583.65]